MIKTNENFGEKEVVLASETIASEISDSLVRGEDMSKKECKKNAKELEKMEAFIATLRKQELGVEGAGNFQRFQAMVFEVTKDQLITGKEILWLRTYRNHLFDTIVLDYTIYRPDSTFLFKWGASGVSLISDSLAKSSDSLFNAMETQALLDKWRISGVSLITDTLTKTNDSLFNFVKTRAPIIDVIWQRRLIDTVAQNTLNSIYSRTDNIDDKRVQLLDGMISKKYNDTIEIDAAIKRLKTDFKAQRIKDYKLAVELLNRPLLNLRISVLMKDNTMQKVDIYEPAILKSLVAELQTVELKQDVVYSKSLEAVLEHEFIKALSRLAKTKKEEIQ